MTCVEFTVNGLKCSVNSTLHPDTSLFAYLRYHLGLPGTKAMCHQGVCGSCIVNVCALRQTTYETETFSVNSCLILVFSCHGWDITTIEAIGNRAEGYHEIQKRIAACNGTQCGYCTPGWVMQLYSLLPKKLKKHELENSFGSNTCRCTGYRPILDAIKSFATDADTDQIDDIEDLVSCFNNKAKCDRRCSVNSDWSVVSEGRSHGDVIMLKFEDSIFFKVYEEEQIFNILNIHGDDCYMFIDGNTAKAILKNDYPPCLIDISDVATLKQYHVDQNLVVGANITLEDFIDICKDIAKNIDGFAYLEEFVKHLDLVAQIPVRKVGSLAGNLMIKHISPSYQSDVFLIFEAVGAVISIRNASGIIEILALPDFLHYDMRGKLIVNLVLPPLGSSSIFRSYKIMPRSQNALAIVNVAFNFNINFANDTIDEAVIVYGNISADFIHATITEVYLKGKKLFDNNVIQGAVEVLRTEINPTAEPPKAAPAVRRKLAISLFYKFILSIAPSNLICPRFTSGGVTTPRPLSSGCQNYQTDSSLYPLNQPLQKLEAIIQSSGEARYVNDTPPMPREVFGAFVLSTVHNGDVDEVYPEDVLKIEGVIAVLTARNIPGKNSFTRPGFQLQTEYEEILADKNIKFYGQPVAIVVAITERLAVKVAQKVTVTYKNVKNTPPVLTINDAKKDRSRVIAGPTIDPKSKGNDVSKVIKGIYELKCQYHYYLEPMSCLVVPVDQGLEVFDATQWMDLTQAAIAQCLNICESKVHVKVRRIGGGFGGKLSRNVQVACACAIVASALDRPCRFVLPLETNITIAGRRLPCQCEYEVGVDTNGKIQYLEATITEDDGWSHNENILSYVSEGFPNCYNSDNFNLKTFAVTTNTPSNSFARAPGTLEGISSIENIMEHIAFELQKDPTDVRLANMRKDDNDLPSLIENLKQKSDYDSRVKCIETFNKNNRWVKKAIKINVMLFPVQFYGNYTAMVSIYRGDGTVTVTTGGIEMGQGVNTKAAQVCAYELGISVDMISILPSYSFVAANNVFSGSSIVSESVCYAIIKACYILKERLQLVREQLNNPTWYKLIEKAAELQIDLTASYMMKDSEPDLSSYSAFAVAIVEVQLDCLTGKFQIDRADLLEDVGLSANPNIDVGQLEGAYVQGLSYYTYEDFVYDAHTGQLLTSDALTYEVYLARDIPVDFRVYFRYNSKNPKGVLGAKAVGEMGVCTSHGILYALRQCIMESRQESGYDATEWFDMDIPLTTEAIIKALNVKTSEFVI